MNYYKMEQLATPRPWHVRYVDTPAYGTLPQIMSSDTQIEASGFLHNGFVHSALLAHCRNNFIKALEALKKMRSEMTGDITLSQWEWYDNQIAELEEVK